MLHSEERRVMGIRTPVIGAVSALAIFLPVSVFGGNQSRAEKIAPCNTVPEAVAERRQATWKWEKELEVNRTPTEFMERKTSSCPYLKYLKREWSLRADKRFRTTMKLERDARAAIRWVFGPYADEALDVAWCESRHSVWAENGQYLGLFQMGSYARSEYGHSDTAIGQARAAHAYFVASGRDWSPWQCRPGGYLGW